MEWNELNRIIWNGGVGIHAVVRFYRLSFIAVLFGVSVRYEKDSENLSLHECSDGFFIQLVLWRILMIVLGFFSVWDV